VKKTHVCSLAASLVMLAAAPAIAHHSIDAEFDRDKPIEVKGTVTKVEWMNPHIWIYLDVKDASGKVTPWQFEGGAPNSMRRNGVSRNALKQGDTITINGILAKDGSNTGNARQVTFADGRSVFARDPGEAKSK
jgi:hypothetical protein